MRTNTRILIGASVLAIGVGLQAPAAGISQGRTAEWAWTPPRTTWGHPDIHGTYTISGETNTPLERPDQFQSRSLEDFDATELAALEKPRHLSAARAEEAAAEGRR